MTSEQQPRQSVVLLPDLAANRVSPAGRIDSWKDIAVYLNRGVRTVQRWEREEGLPVHRLHHEKLGSVFAFRTELDAWLAGRCGDLEGNGAVEPPPASVAVLPFTDMSREKDQEYFCEGIAEEIISALRGIEGLQVASRTSAARFKTESADVRTIARRLRVATLLEGSIRHSGDRLRIAVQLTDAESGYQLWSETYDRLSSDIFAIQEEIARNVVQALELTLSANESAALRRTPTTDVQAYDCYLRGRRFYYRYGPRDVEFALQLFARAVELDSRYARAYAGLADCWVYMYLHAGRADAVREQADWASARAVELDPGSAQAHSSRALALSVNGHNEAAEAEFETAARLDPKLFEAYYFHARHCFIRGEPARAAVLYEQAMHIRPEDFQSPLLAAQIYDDLGQPEEAREARRRGIAAAEEHLNLNPDDARALYMAANGMVALGHREMGREWAERALAMRPDDPMLLYNVGCIYALLDMPERAIDCLESGYRYGVAERGWYEHDSNLDSLRGHPRFRALLGRLP